MNEDGGFFSGGARVIFTPQFLLLTISSFFFFVGVRMYPVFLPVFIEQNLGGSTADVGILFSLTPLVAIFFRLPMGRHIDVKGRKNILVLGAAIYVTIPILFSMAPNTAFLGVFRILQGVGIAAYTVASLAMAVDLAPKQRVGEAVGVFSGASMLAMAIGPMVAGGVVDSFGYIGTFYIIAAISAFALCLCLLLQERFSPQESGFRLSIREVIRDTNLISACIAAFFLEFTYNVVAVFIPLYITSLLLGASDIGVFFSVYALATIASRPLAGRASDRAGRKRVILPMMAVGALAIGLLPLAGNLMAFAGIAVLYGLGFGASFAPSSAMAVDTVHPGVKGAALAVYYCFIDLGLTAGAASMGFFAQAYGFKALFGADAAILIVGVVAFAFASRRVKSFRARSSGRREKRF